MELIAQGKIKKKILPGSKIPSTISKSDINFINSEQPGHNFVDNDDNNGRDYVNDGLNKLDGKVEENNEVVNL
jgi:hypothetical protein